MKRLKRRERDVFVPIYLLLMVIILLCPIALKIILICLLYCLGACSCYCCLIGHNKRELLVYCGATLAVVSSHNVADVFLFVSIINLTLGMILLSYKYHIYGTNWCCNCKAKAGPTSSESEPIRVVDTLVKFWYYLQSIKCITFNNTPSLSVSVTEILCESFLLCLCVSVCRVYCIQCLLCHIHLIAI